MKVTGNLISVPDAWPFDPSEVFLVPKLKIGVSVSKVGLIFLGCKGDASGEKQGEGLEIGALYPNVGLWNSFSGSIDFSLITLFGLSSLSPFLDNPWNISGVASVAASGDGWKSSFLVLVSGSCFRDLLCC